MSTLPLYDIPTMWWGKILRSSQSVKHPFKHFPQSVRRRWCHRAGCEEESVLKTMS